MSFFYLCPFISTVYYSSVSLRTVRQIGPSLLHAKHVDMSLYLELARQHAGTHSIHG